VQWAAILDASLEHRYRASDLQLITETVVSTTKGLATGSIGHCHASCGEAGHALWFTSQQPGFLMKLRGRMCREKNYVPAEEYDSIVNAWGKTHNNSSDAQDGDVQNCEACVECVFEQVAFIEIPI
jgi:hypothetical protein